jgi:hypothetical protein
MIVEEVVAFRFNVESPAYASDSPALNTASAVSAIQAILPNPVISMSPCVDVNVVIMPR